MTQETEIKKAVCVWCKGECGVLVHVKDGHLVKLEEDPDYGRKVWPATRGCVRFRAAAEFMYHPDRVNFPLKRVGDRGEGKWQRISWDQALDEIAEKLTRVKDKYGAEGIGFTRGTGFRQEDEPRQRFLELLGSPNSASPGNICFIPRSMVADAIVGYFPLYSVRANTKCIVLLGAETQIARPITALSFREAVKNGAKVIVIDPRKTESASKADVWLQLRPGTDCALLLGMINVMINEELYDKEFVEKWCYGFDKLREHVAEYTPEKVEKITEVPADKIREATRVYATNKPGTMVEGMGIEEAPQNAEILHARWILAALAGNIDVEGGEELHGVNPRILNGREAIPYPPMSLEQKNKQLGADRFKFLLWPGRDMIIQERMKYWGRVGSLPAIGYPSGVWRAILTGQPYPIRAMLTYTNNPMVTLANTKLIYKALKSLDSYVVIEQWMTPSAELADYVLPATCWLERAILWDFSNYSNWLVAGEQALPASIPGEYDHRDDFYIWRGLGIRMGQEQYWPHKSLEEVYDAMLKPTGLTHKEFVHQIRCEKKTKTFKEYERKGGFATPTGKAELYSTIFEKLGYDPLPRYVEFSETQIGNPELAKEYPLMLLTGGRSREYYHSEWRQIESIRKLHPHPLLQIHPDTAQKLGISEGDWVWIETLRGRVRNKATLFDGIKPDVVHAEHGWWLPELPGEEPWLRGAWDVNINVCLDDDPDVCNQLTAGYPLRTALCKVYKAKTY
jgi:anaerobic selenocysteine-containing dehydrogenase